MKRSSFRYFYNRNENLPLMKAIGWERRTNPKFYNWDCQNRENKHCLFQYTVSGEGEVEIEGKVHRLEAGKAFLIEIPGPYQYRLPKDSDHWELKFLDFSLDTLPLWHSIVEKSGRIIEIDTDSEVLKSWKKLYKVAELAEIHDIYNNSVYTYQFLMELKRLINIKSRSPMIPTKIQQTLDFINDHADEPIGIDEMSQQVGISKYYLHRLFRNSIGVTPKYYLTKKRMEIAAQLLVETNLTNKEIAKKSGYSYGNYFAKVFRNWMHTSPEQFRKESIEKRNWRIHID